MTAATKHVASISYDTANGRRVHVVSTLTGMDAAVRLAIHWGQNRLHPDVFDGAQVTYLGQDDTV